MDRVKTTISMICCTLALATRIFAQQTSPSTVQRGKTPDGCTAAPGAKAGAGGYADRVAHEKTGIELVLISPGSFNMGAEGVEAHKVFIAKPFYIGKTPVTNGQYKKFLAGGYDGVKDCDPAYDLHVRHLRGKSLMPAGDDYPVVFVSWKNARAFCRWAGGLDLPTEAEWEYACRAGTTSLFSFGDSKDVDQYAWTSFNSQGTTQPVGQLKPNPWGLYDMHGNVWEWCLDDYVFRYQGAPADGSACLVDPSAQIEGAMTKALRGGSWSNTLMYAVDSTARYNVASVVAANDIGFRVALRTD